MSATGSGPNNARFFVMPGVPRNVADAGWTAEEAKSTKGTPHKSIRNAAANPMITAARAGAAAKLLARKRGGTSVDKPQQPDNSFDDGVPTELGETRSAHHKMGSDILDSLADMADDELRERVKNSIGSVMRLQEELAQTVALSEMIVSRRLAGSRG